MRLWPFRRDRTRYCIVVGLGNPGDEYARTRHNVGFRVVDLLADRYDIAVRRRRHQSIIGTGAIDETPVLLAKPQCFVNNSGFAVRRILDYHHAAPRDLLVICDDVNLPVGRIRIRPRGSHGGHKGLRSIEECLDTRDYPRLRIGVGRPGEGGDLVEHVLSPFKRAEEPLVDEAVSRAVSAVRVTLTHGLESAMNEFN
ncbi:MAG: aminoacyl-tRNA hydrolase [Armatimonadota bacterium]